MRPNSPSSFLPRFEPTACLTFIHTDRTQLSSKGLRVTSIQPGATNSELDSHITHEETKKVQHTNLSPPMVVKVARLSPVVASREAKGSRRRFASLTPTTSHGPSCTPCRSRPTLPSTRSSFAPRSRARKNLPREKINLYFPCSFIFLLLFLFSFSFSFLWPQRNRFQFVSTKQSINAQWILISNLCLYVLVLDLL